MTRGTWGAFRGDLGLGRVLFAAACFGLWASAQTGCIDTTKDSNEEEEEETDTEKDTGEEVDGGETDSDSAGSSCGANDGSLMEADAEELFNLDHVPTFEVTLPEKDWQYLQEHAVDEEYKEAKACFEGRSIGTVGLRFKGSYGSLYNCFNEDGENTCRKLSMKLKFDEYDTENRFYGLKRLNFQGYRYDGSYMKEKLAYELYRSMDIVAPRALWANLVVNGELQGLFGMVEQIDGRFTADRWPNNADQNLYKEAWPVKNDEEWAITRLETNEDIADVSAFVDFSQAMLDADTDNLRETFGKYADLDYFARYMAVDDATANFDGVTAYYTSDDLLWSGNHNFFLYQESADLFTIIPWDLESTFSVGSFGNVPHWTTLPEDCSVTYPAWGDWNTPVIAPGCDRVFQALAADMTSYKEAAQALLDDLFTEEAMSEQIDDYYAFIKDEAEADPNGPGKSSFESEVKNLKAQIPILRERLSLIMNGETWTPFEINADGITDLEQQDSLGLTIGPQLYYNANTTVSLSINTDSPIDGERDLLIAFEFGDEEKAWDQWVNYIVALKGGVHDVRELTGIRLRIRADQSRPFRLEMDNTYASSVNNWIREGWDIDVSEEATEVEVLFEDAAPPSWAASQGLEPVATLDQVLSAVKGLLFAPQCVGRDNKGFLPDDTTDEGFIEIDNIEFF